MSPGVVGYPPTWGMPLVRYPQTTGPTAAHLYGGYQTNSHLHNMVGFLFFFFIIFFAFFAKKIKF